MEPEKFSHLDEKSNIQMVDISEKSITERIAIAECKVKLKPEVIKKIKENKIAKGNVITTAKVAGIMGAKKTSTLIPLTHNIDINHIDIEIQLNKEEIEIICKVKTEAKTGAEMEALTGAAITALTIYDMCKSVQKDIIIEELKLLYKKGGKSGEYKIEGNRREKYKKTK